MQGIKGYIQQHAVDCANQIEYITIEDYLKTLDQAVLSRSMAEKSFRAIIGKKPKFHKGKYGSKYDYWTCGNCGAELVYSVCEEYCHHCGYRQLWGNPACLTGK